MPICRSLLSLGLFYICNYEHINIVESDIAQFQICFPKYPHIMVTKLFQIAIES